MMKSELLGENFYQHPRRGCLMVKQAQGEAELRDGERRE